MSYAIPNLIRYVSDHNKSKRLKKSTIALIDPLKIKAEMQKDDIDLDIEHLKKLGMENPKVITSKRL